MSEKKKALTQFHRENILNAAETLFAEKGIEKTTMDDIAQKAEYSKATLYVYFKNKDEIFNAITLKSMNMLYERLKRSVPENAPTIEQYHAICRELVRYNDEYPLYYDNMLSEINVEIENSDTPVIFSEIFETGEKINTLITSILKNGVTQKVFREDILIPQTIMILWACISGIVRIAGNKQKYIEKSISISKDNFMQYGFETLLRSIKA